jgi:hypothetical protein
MSKLKFATDAEWWHNGADKSEAPNATEEK